MANLYWKGGGANTNWSTIANWTTASAGTTAATASPTSIDDVIFDGLGVTGNTNANFTRIDASNGRPIRTFNGTITDCVNVEQVNDLITNTSTFVRTV